MLYSKTNIHMNI